MTNKFNTEADIHIGRNSYIEEGHDNAYEVVLFGGTKRYNQNGRLYRNNIFSKSFTNKEDAIRYYKKLVDDYNFFVNTRGSLGDLYPIEKGIYIEEG